MARILFLSPGVYAWDGLAVTWIFSPFQGLASMLQFGSGRGESPLKGLMLDLVASESQA
jgi:hypothetical protein